MSDATWSTTDTGKVYHSFKADGTALCRSNIKADQCRTVRTEAEVDKALTKPWGISTQGYRKCASCAKKEAAFRERLAASMEPSTGEGDYLPPAETTPTTEEDDVNTQTGPLTERQITILEHTLTGMSQKEIARKLGIPLTTIGRDNYFTARKFKAKKITEAVAIYATALAYRNASVQLLSGRIARPVDEAEDHVNHVLDRMAALLRDWSDQRMPR